MFQIKAKIIYNRVIRSGYLSCLLDAPLIAKKAKPGQFLHIKINTGYRPFLRRPFSIHEATGSRLNILYEVLGKGTKALSLKKTGEHLDIIGPLGNGFSYHSPLTDYHLSLLVAGGMGVAPLLFLARKIKSDYPKYAIWVLIGAKTKRGILCEKEFKKLGCEVKIATDDGSKGFKGKVTALLERQLRTTHYELRTIYACGPRPMLKETNAICKKYKISGQISLEEHLACGIGACLG